VLDFIQTPTPQHQNNHNASTMTTKPTAPSKGQSSTSVPTAKPQCKIHASAIIADKAQLTGPNVIEIGENTILHPHAKVKAEHGNVVIGKGCILSERATIGASEASEEGYDIVIGDGVNLESGAIVEARRIGDHSTIGVNSKIGRGAVLGKWCKIAPLCEVRALEVLDDYTVVFGEGQKGRRIDAAVRDKREIREAKLKGMEMEREVLKGIISDNKIKWTM
jgi:dynactin 6